MEGGIKMKQICISCKTQYGMKEPILDKLETHGICNDCLTDIRKRKENIKKMFKLNPRNYKME
jgi:hypothetical protein